MSEKLRSNILLWISTCLLIIALVSCSGSYKKEYQFDFMFEEDQEGWVTGFADLPADSNPAFYELDSGWSTLPAASGYGTTGALGEENQPGFDRGREQPNRRLGSGGSGPAGGAGVLPPRRTHPACRRARHTGTHRAAFRKGIPAGCGQDRVGGSGFDGGGIKVLGIGDWRLGIEGWRLEI